MSTSDAIAIGAACVGAGLAILAIVIAVAAVFGYASIRKEAKESAERVARDEISKILNEGSGLGDKIRLQIQKLMESEADKLYSDISLSGAFEGDSPAGDVAEEYPKDPND